MCMYICVYVRVCMCMYVYMYECVRVCGVCGVYSDRVDVLHHEMYNEQQ